MLGLASASTASMARGATRFPRARPAPARAATRATASRFLFTPDVTEQLRALWSSSADAKQERVACLGGDVADGVWHLSRIEPLSMAADSLSVSARASIERCGPPHWLGTVHTHVALRDGVSPYSTFSGADRGVIRMWWSRWGSGGVFCLLYSDHDAHCEADGLLIAGPETITTY